MNLIPLELDVTPITGAISEISAAAPALLTAGIGVSVLFFGVPFLWRKARGLMK